MQSTLKPPFSTAASSGAAAAGVDGQNSDGLVFLSEFSQDGVNLRWMEYPNLGEARSSTHTPGSLVIYLNYSGQAMYRDGFTAHELGAAHAAIFPGRFNAPRIDRAPGGMHRFLVLEVSSAFLRMHFGQALPLLTEAARQFASGTPSGSFIAIQPLNTALLTMRLSLLDPPVARNALPTWYTAKAIEIISHTLYAPEATGDFFCKRHQRQNRERADRAAHLLERDLTNPPSLEMLAEEIGCSPFHLSRIFSEELGMNIPRFLRTRRIERAAHLLKQRGLNVTEAAMAVGYSSLSAFNKAFVEQLGVCPGLYAAIPRPLDGRKLGKAGDPPE